MATDLEDLGLSSGPILCTERLWLLTVDFEAFRPSSLDVWLAAMEAWGEAMLRTQLRFSVFLSLEDVAALRAQDPSGYGRFVKAVSTLHAAGCRFYPHNHRVFDTTTGDMRERTHKSHHVPGYTKRTSMFYDVVRLNNLPFSEWLSSLDAEDSRLHDDAGIPRPAQRAFRPGGWDHGSEAEEIRAYVAALASAGFRFDSSATAGVYGTPTWRVGAEFGQNVFSLGDDMVEVAASSWLNCGHGPRSARTAMLVARLLRQHHFVTPWHSGIQCTVLHFDHLFHSRSRGQLRYFSIADPKVVGRRVASAFRLMVALRTAFRLYSATFDDLELHAGRLGLTG